MLWCQCKHEEIKQVKEKRKTRKINKTKEPFISLFIRKYKRGRDELELGELNSWGYLAF